MFYAQLLQITLKATTSRSNRKIPSKQSCPFPYLFFFLVFCLQRASSTLEGSAYLKQLPERLEIKTGDDPRRGRGEGREEQDGQQIFKHKRGQKDYHYT